MVDMINLAVGAFVIGFGAGYAGRMWLEWWQARKLRREIAGLLTQRLRKLNTVRKLRVVK